ncbi:MAG: signal peptidase I [Candidatus Lokiarchaeota archaeon]|nr:signal peptidase I [Candidatus Lokiarchaeota archaeon]
MQRIKSALKWDTRSETAKTIFLLAIVVGGTFGGYGIFMVAMGTTSPLVVVTSGSMEPTLYRGDLLVIQAHAQDDIQVGDIIVFVADWYDASPIVHRIIEIQEQPDGTKHFYTKGDNNSNQDPNFRTIDEIMGVVIHTAPGVGNISLWMRSGGYIPVIIVFIILLFGPEIYEYFKEDELEESETISDDTVNE